MAGRVEVDGWDVTIDPHEVRKLIGYMPDHAGVYERVTVREYAEGWRAGKVRLRPGSAARLARRPGLEPDPVLRGHRKKR